MRFSITGLLRLAFLIGLGSTVLAIEVARVTPKELHARIPRKSRVVGLTGLAFAGTDESTRFFDPDTGTVGRLSLPQGEHFEDAECSPWRDETGMSHVVGRWRKDEGHAGNEIMTDMGLACYTYPQGEEIGRIECDSLPQGGACWYPGSADRVLFASADGTLRHVTFRTSARPPQRPLGDEGMSVPLRWEVPHPGEGTIMVRQPFWPSAPGFEHMLLVSLRYFVKEPTERGYSEAQIWWLRLDKSGTSIVGAGRLTQPQSAARDESSPSLGAIPGGLALAYVTCAPDHSERTLHLAPVRLDPKTGEPQADSARTVVITDDCADTPAGFSGDGRRLYSLVHPRNADARIERFSVPLDLAGP